MKLTRCLLASGRVPRRGCRPVPRALGWLERLLLLPDRPTHDDDFCQRRSLRMGFNTRRLVGTSSGRNSTPERCTGCG